MRFNLKNYSLFAISYLSLHQSGKGEVVYTDIDPDKILDNPGEGLNIDIDNNGTIDFTFLNSSFTTYNASFESYQTVQDILVGPHIPSNSIAGVSKSFTGIYYHWTWYFPYALEHFDIVNSELQWQNSGVQIMALRTIYHNGEGVLPCLDCYWYSYFIPEVVDRYLGVKFVDELNQSYYGWIRCDVKDEGRKLIIKDYAYETTPEMSITAGDSIGTTGINTNDALSIQIYNINNLLNVRFNTQPTKAASIKVYSISGQLEYNQNKVSQNTSVRLNVATGIYLVVVEDVNRYWKQSVSILNN